MNFIGMWIEKLYPPSISVGLDLLTTKPGRVTGLGFSTFSAFGIGGFPLPLPFGSGGLLLALLVHRLWSGALTLLEMRSHDFVAGCAEVVFA